MLPDLSALPPEVQQQIAQIDCEGFAIGGLAVGMLAPWR